jgi:hypothetical protein
LREEFACRAQSRSEPGVSIPRARPLPPAPPDCSFPWEPRSPSFPGELPARHQANLQPVRQRNGLKDRPQLVVPVRTPAEDRQSQVDFCVGFERNPFHGGDN